MFDRKAHSKEYYANQYRRRKAEGRCTACGEKLTPECTAFLCEYCRKKAKYSRVAKVNISKRIAEAKADTVRKYREQLHRAFAHSDSKDKFNKGFFLEMVDLIAKEMEEAAYE